MRGKLRRLKIYCVFVTLLVCLPTGPAFAGGALRVKASGQPFVWPNGGRNIVFRTDLGGLGNMSNAEAVAQTEAAFGEWEAIPTATASYINGGPLPFDVDETNFASVVLYAPPDGINPIVYDEDGAIFDLLYGRFSGVLGFAQIQVDDESGEIVDGEVVLNGAAAAAFGDEFLGTQVHEIGHFSGLDHSVVNGEVLFFGDSSGPSPHNTFALPPSYLGRIETMYPLSAPGDGAETPDADDRAIFSTLYPEPDFYAHSGSITGHIRGLNGRTPVNGINVIARNIADPFGDAVSAISGNLATTDDPDDPLAGVYILNGLTPGAQYAVYVDELDFDFYPSGGYTFTFGEGSGKRSFLPGPEDFYNGALESGNPETDDPADFTPLTAVAGYPLTGIDIIFNHLRPGPIPPEAFDDGREFFRPWLALLLPFTFEIGDRKTDTVFLNAYDGTLSFGEPEEFFTPFDKAFKKHLAGPPRIAGLMTQLNPYIFGKGLLSFEETVDTFTVRYIDVPEVLFDSSSGFPPPILPGGSSTFSITLHDKDQPGRGNLVTLSYGDINAEKAVVGYSCGGQIASGFEPEYDLSLLAGRPIRGAGSAAISEEFVDSDLDLDYHALTFEIPGPFHDQFEPNNSQSTARHVNLPFNTANDFAEITPGDVDFYRFKAKAGEILVAETASAGAPLESLDTVIGLFAPDGTRLATNDGILPGLPFSRVIFSVPSDGEYTLGVTTSPDFNFKGAGSESGRYVLTMDTYRGMVLPLFGDDVAVELPLGFRFPFQGTEWTSVWVSSNGNLTFGAPETINFIEDIQVEGFLAGPPRIAPFFTDLDPSGSYNYGVFGLVIADKKSNSLTIHWVSVPRILDFDTNTFSVTLTSAGNILMDWGAALGEDYDGRGVIVGITKGGGAVDPGPIDLSRFIAPSAKGTNYEQFATTIIYKDLGPDVSGVNIPSFDLSFDELNFIRHDKK